MKNIIAKFTISSAIVAPVLMTAILFTPVFAETTITTTVAETTRPTETKKIEPTHTTSTAGTKTSLVERTQALTNDTREESLRIRGLNEIAKRVTSLNSLVTKIGTLKRLTSTQKATFIININTEITSLNTLKVKIQADTNLDTLKADVKSVVDSFRVYAVYEPSVRILISTDMIASTADKTTMLAEKLNTKILEAQTKGKDVTSLTSTYNDMLAKIADAKAQISAAESIALVLKPADYPSNKSSIESARADVKTATTDLKTARSDAQQIYASLKAFGITETIKPSLTASPAVTNAN